MDYLDPKKLRRDNFILIVGYILVGASIIIATLVLVYQAYGFGLSQNGTVIQNGLVFFSSQPNPADIYINGVLNPSTTNTRLVLQSGQYNVKLSRAGYRSWQRSIVFDAGSVEHFDYPVLFPNTLASKSIQSYNSAPGLATQSPDRRWMLVEQPGSMTDFNLYDLKNPATPVETTLSLPANLLTKSTTSESLQYNEWSDDNQHILLTHLYDGKTEFILVNRNDPTQSINLNNALGTSPTKLTLNNKKYDKYYVYNATAASLDTASISTGNALTPYLQNVLAYQPYGNNTMLYVTNTGAPNGKVLVNLLNGSQTITIRTLPVSPNYLVDLTQYSGNLYVAAGSTSDGRIYIYQDPIGQYNNQDATIIPSQVLQVPQADYLSFSDNAQFIVTENATNFAVYDIENAKSYSYNSRLPLDSPQIHATWMDGDRIMYVSGGKLVVFDYDHTNGQTLMSGNGAYLPYFSANYKYVFNITSGATQTRYDLDQTPMLIPADL